MAQASPPRPPERPRATAAPGRPTTPAAHDAAANPVAALVNDPTLRPGDVVVFPDGPKVFRGGGQAPHTLAAFEDVRRSAAVSPATREALAGATSPAAPAQVAEAASRAGAAEGPERPAHALSGAEPPFRRS